MDAEMFRLLLTPSGQAALAEAAALAPTEAAFLACFETLRKHHPQSLAKSALETALLRVKVRDKFADADRMYFTREAPNRPRAMSSRGTGRSDSLRSGTSRTCAAGSAATPSHSRRSG